MRLGGGVVCDYSALRPRGGHLSSLESPRYSHLTQLDQVVRTAVAYYQLNAPKELVDKESWPMYYPGMPAYDKARTWK